MDCIAGGRPLAGGDNYRPGSTIQSLSRDCCGDQAGKFGELSRMCAFVVVARLAQLANVFLDILQQQSAASLRIVFTGVEDAREQNVAERFLEMAGFPMPAQLAGRVPRGGHLFGGVGQKTSGVSQFNVRAGRGGLHQFH